MVDVAQVERSVYERLNVTCVVGLGCNRNRSIWASARAASSETRSGVGTYSLPLICQGGMQELGHSSRLLAIAKGFRAVVKRCGQ